MISKIKVTWLSAWSALLAVWLTALVAYDSRNPALSLATLFVVLWFVFNLALVDDAYRETNAMLDRAFKGWGEANEAIRQAYDAGVEEVYRECEAIAAKKAERWETLVAEGNRYDKGTRGQQQARGCGCREVGDEIAHARATRKGEG